MNDHNRNPQSALAVEVGRLLRERHLMLAAAESCTGGLIGDLITDIAGSSDYFLGSVVSYAYSAKEAILGVRHETLLAHGAVSPETAAEMAWGARRLFRADIAVSVTGIAGPTGGTPEKPVGLVCLHLSAADAEVGVQRRWDGDRVENKQRSAETALQMVLDHLRGQSQSGTSTPEFVAEPVTVETRSLPNGDVLPTSFVWQGQTYGIADYGRQWDERQGTRAWRCYLVRTAHNDTFELRHDVAGGEWVLARAWLAPWVA